MLMRALEFIMRRRACRVILMLLGIPLITPAILALAALRRGPGEGLFLLAWGLLPIIVAGATGFMSPLMFGLSATQLAAVFCGALVLRRTTLWSKALIVLAAVAAAGILLTSRFIDHGVMHNLLEVVAASNDAAKAQLQQIFGSESQVTGYLALISAITTTLALLLGRWWQALLYNPGALRPELHGLKIPLPFAAAGMLLWIYGLSSEQFVFWGAMAAFPTIVAGAALVHWFVANRKWGKGPLVVLYLMLVIAALPVAGFLSGLALIDSWIDIRARLANKV